MSKLWRSLDEQRLPPSPPGRTDEFPPGTSEWDPSLSRRDFLRVSSAGLALAGLTGCGGKAPGAEAFVPYVSRPETLGPADRAVFATAQCIAGRATGLLVTSFEGRPIKADGNPRHPASEGGSLPWQQAYPLDVYSPSRARGVEREGEASGWPEFFAFLDEHTAHDGDGVHLLLEASTSPTEARLLAKIRSRLPRLRVTRYEPLLSDAAEAGCALAFGRRATPRYDFARAGAVVSLDADFLFTEGPAARHARAFAGRRRGPSRLFLCTAECSPTLTGANADQRLALSPAALARFAAELFGVSGTSEFAAPLRELRRRLPERGTVFLAGAAQPPWIHALCQQANLRQGGETVSYAEPVHAAADAGSAGLAALATELGAGRGALLLSLGGNPAYAAPAPLALRAAFAKAGAVAHLSPAPDETSALAAWRLPASHPLEAWGDALAEDGTATILQPLAEPIGDTRSSLEILAHLAGEGGDTRALVAATWRSRWGAKFTERWNEALETGLVAGSAFPALALHSRPLRPPAAPAAAPEWEIVFRPDEHLLDGRFFGSAWLQELPRPLTQLAWGNAALLSPRSAARLGVKDEDLLLVECEGRSLRAPALVQPGHPEGTVTLTFGYGRRDAAFGPEPIGYDAYAIWPGTPSAPGKVSAAGGTAPLCREQLQPTEGASEAIRFTPLPPPPAPLSLYPTPPLDPSPNAWAMAIDLDRCTGCQACVLACQAENNIPSVGPEALRRGRRMHWIRVDRYFEGAPEAPRTHFQPLPCMHCEKAPCEPVCPVGATLHSDDGLNEMVYNRCVGTRYCSNNCPYKVRRFNFFEYNKHSAAVLALGRNPEVSVRPRGVMEKCTYCVQRIVGARVAAEGENRPLRDGEVVTACQAACPAEAIRFGNQNDPGSRVAEWKRHPAGYALLDELGTRPRTTYLAKEGRHD